MMRNNYSKFSVYIKRNKWKLVFYICLLASLIVVGFYSYNRYYVYNRSKEVVALETQINNKKSEIKQYYKDTDYQKYSYAEFIYEKEKTQSWYFIITSLIGIYDKLESLGTKNDHIVFQNFSVRLNSISLQGSISNLGIVYSENGLIDKFKNLDFIDYIQIPSYTSKDNDYTFNLTAKINIYEPKGKSGDSK